MKIYTVEELSQHLEDDSANPDWLAVRAGKFTGSDFYVFMGLLKNNKLTETAESLLCKKVLESMGEPVAESFKTAAMERGTELEPIARAEYIAETFEDVQEVGFVDLEQLHAGCSPDGVIYQETTIIDDMEVQKNQNGEVELVKTAPKKLVFQRIDKIIEIKCPEIKNYLKMAKGDIPENYMVQCQYNMFITGAKSCDFVIYHPDMRLVVHKINPDKQYQENIKTILVYLNARYDEILGEIKEYKK